MPKMWQSGEVFQGRKRGGRMKVKKITKPELDGDTYLIAQAVNHNAELLKNALDRIEELEKVKPCEEGQEPILEKVRSEIEAQEKWLAEAGYNAYNVGIAFESVKRALGK